MVSWQPQVAAMTERGQLATEPQRSDVELLVGRLEELKAEEEQPFKDENMVRSVCVCGDVFLLGRRVRTHGGGVGAGHRGMPFSANGVKVFNSARRISFLENYYLNFMLCLTQTLRRSGSGAIQKCSVVPSHCDRTTSHCRSSRHEPWTRRVASQSGLPFSTTGGACWGFAQTQSVCCDSRTPSIVGLVCCKKRRKNKTRIMLCYFAPLSRIILFIYCLNVPQAFDAAGRKQVGTWTLVYSSSQAFRSSPFFATFQALLGREGVAEKIFSFTDAIPNAKIGQARQIVNEDCTELVSRVDMSVWPHRCARRLYLSIGQSAYVVLQRRTALR